MSMSMSQHRQAISSFAARFLSACRPRGRIPRRRCGSRACRGARAGSGDGPASVARLLPRGRRRARRRGRVSSQIVGCRIMVGRRSKSVRRWWVIVMPRRQGWNGRVEMCRKAISREPRMMRLTPTLPCLLPTLPLSLSRLLMMIDVSTVYARWLRNAHVRSVSSSWQGIRVCPIVVCARRC